MNKNINLYHSDPQEFSKQTKMFDFQEMVQLHLYAADHNDTQLFDALLPQALQYHINISLRQAVVRGNEDFVRHVYIHADDQEMMHSLYVSVDEHHHTLFNFLYHNIKMSSHIYGVCLQRLTQDRNQNTDEAYFNDILCSLVNMNTVDNIKRNAIKKVLYHHSNARSKAVLMAYKDFIIAAPIDFKVDILADLFCQNHIEFLKVFLVEDKEARHIYKKRAFNTSGLHNINHENVTQIMDAYIERTLIGEQVNGTAERSTLPRKM